MAHVVLKNVTKRFGNFLAVDDLSLEVRDGELMVLVGPSGCGKTTTLRLIAGLEEISSGAVWIDDQLVNDLSPKDRDVAMVFQNYALYPHMDVYENIAFGLKMRGISTREVKQRVSQIANLLGISDKLKNKPRELSGGQRQRVAVGRAIVRKPKVFLFDEPLSNLDAQLRLHMRAELQAIHRKLKTTMIYVTHDQVEAMTLGQRIAVLRDGELQQVDTPQRLYHHPANVFVAGFIGNPAMNFLAAEVVLRDKHFCLKGAAFSLPLPESRAAYFPKLRDHLGHNVLVGIRPEDMKIELVAQSNNGVLLDVRVEFIELLGSEMIVHGRLGEEKLVVRTGPRELNPDQIFQLWVNADKIYLFDRETNRSLAAVSVSS